VLQVDDRLERDREEVVIDHASDPVAEPASVVAVDRDVAEQVAGGVGQHLEEVAGPLVDVAGVRGHRGQHADDAAGRRLDRHAHERTDAQLRRHRQVPGLGERPDVGDPAGDPTTDDLGAEGVLQRDRRALEDRAVAEGSVDDGQRQDVALDARHPHHVHLGARAGHLEQATHEIFGPVEIGQVGVGRSERHHCAIGGGSGHLKVS